MTTSWPLIAYTLCVVVAAGTLGVQSARALGGRGAGVRGVNVAVSLVASVAAAAFACLRLGRVERVMNVFARPASAVSQTFIAILALIVVGVALVVALRRAEEPGTVPLWLCALGLAASLFGAYAVAAGDVATSLSAGKTALAVAMVACSALVLGTFESRAVDALSSADVPGLGALGVVAGALSGASVAAFAALAPRLGLRAASLTTSTLGFDASHPTQHAGAAAQAASSAWADPLTWVCVAGLGIVVPLVCALLARKARGAACAGLALAGAVSLLVGLAATMHLFMFTSTATRLLM